MRASPFYFLLWLIPSVHVVSYKVTPWASRAYIYINIFWVMFFLYFWLLEASDKELLLFLFCFFENLKKSISLKNSFNDARCCLWRVIAINKQYMGTSKLVSVGVFGIFSIFKELNFLLYIIYGFLSEMDRNFIVKYLRSVVAKGAYKHRRSKMR